MKILLSQDLGWYTLSHESVNVNVNGIGSRALLDFDRIS